MFTVFHCVRERLTIKSYSHLFLAEIKLKFTIRDYVDEHFIVSAIEAYIRSHADENLFGKMNVGQYGKVDSFLLVPSILFCYDLASSAVIGIGNLSCVHLYFCEEVVTVVMTGESKE